MKIWEKLGNPFGENGYADYDDDDDENDMEDEVPAPRNARRSESRSAEPAAAQEPAEGNGFSGRVLNMNSNKPSVVLFHPSNFNEATKGADDLRSKKAVIVNLENVDPSVARRVVDFMSGCAYALEGKVKKIAVSTYLFCPYSMDITGDFETLQAEAEG